MRILIIGFILIGLFISTPAKAEFEGTRAKGNITQSVVNLKNTVNGYIASLTTQRDEIERQVLIHTNLIDTNDKTKLISLKNDITNAISSLQTVSNSIDTKWQNLE